MNKAGIKTIKRRRKEGKTDYLHRLKLLKSFKPRLIFRITNRYLIAQYITSEEAKDRVEIGITSKDLLNLGWPEEFKGSLTSITASYLTGMLIAKKILEGKKEPPIVDFGMIRTSHKTKPFAFLKGVIDGGIEISCKEEAFPEQERIEGKSMKKDFTSNFEKIKLNILKK